MVYISIPSRPALPVLRRHCPFPIAFGIAVGFMRRCIAFYVVYCFASTVVSPSPTELIVGMLASPDATGLAQ